MRPERALVEAFHYEVTPPPWRPAPDSVAELAATRLEAARLHNALEDERQKHARLRAGVERFTQHLAEAAQAASGEDACARLGPIRAAWAAAEGVVAEHLRELLAGKTA